MKGKGRMLPYKTSHVNLTARLSILLHKMVSVPPIFRCTHLRKMNLITLEFFLWVHTKRFWETFITCLAIPTWYTSLQAILDTRSIRSSMVSRLPKYWSMHSITPRNWFVQLRHGDELCKTRQDISRRRKGVSPTTAPVFTATPISNNRLSTFYSVSQFVSLLFHLTRNGSEMYHQVR